VNGCDGDSEAHNAFYRAEVGGETMPWRRNGRWRVKFFNSSVSGRRKEGATPVSKREMSTRGGSWFSRGRTTGDAAVRYRPSTRVG
jgi:hypothetical protein